MLKYIFSIKDIYQKLKNKSMKKIDWNFWEINQVARIGPRNHTRRKVVFLIPPHHFLKTSVAIDIYKAAW